MNSPTSPTSLKATAESLRIEWSDGTVHELPWAFVRDNCPCATCRLAKEPPPQQTETPPQADLLPVLDVAETQPLRVLGMKPVGNYAYSINFSDGHSTGIYTVDYLRRLGEAAASAAS